MSSTTQRPTVVCNNENHYQYMDECGALLSMKYLNYLTIEDNSGWLLNVQGADARRSAINRARLLKNPRATPLSGIVADDKVVLEEERQRHVDEMRFIIMGGRGG